MLQSYVRSKKICVYNKYFKKAFGSWKLLGWGGLNPFPINLPSLPYVIRSCRLWINQLADVHKQFVETILLEDWHFKVKKQASALDFLLEVLIFRSCFLHSFFHIVFFANQLHYFSIGETLTTNGSDRVVDLFILMINLMKFFIFCKFLSIRKSDLEKILDLLANWEVGRLCQGVMWIESHIKHPYLDIHIDSLILFSISRNYLCPEQKFWSDETFIFHLDFSVLLLSTIFFFCNLDLTKPGQNILSCSHMWYLARLSIICTI